ncbi:MAG: acetolactate synthase [Xanthomonadales bacterium]|nr:acetolactate synthase [Xanthomonadales bacterium]NIN59947.1 acetolactate synthase [Xanthomonadales bacterium]NIN75321.1 acetolactate synthase [Xanthomonadales bacterium]NIO13489.1 acetolactate synthase [Xanthomonadales bacterium]NIP12340.1 acetolactate synthase [Xanthomonadales bacterium]
MEHRLLIELKNCEGALLRALGLVERRGYRIRTCNLRADEADRSVLELTVFSERPGALLKRQLERLHDVLGVRLEESCEPWVRELNKPSIARTQ